MLLVFLLNGLFNLVLGCSFQPIGCNTLTAITTQEIIRTANANIFDAIPGIKIAADRVEPEGKNRIVFKGSVVLRRDGLPTFYANEVKMEISDDRKLESVRMIGKVSMEGIGVMIHSERAFSDNFDLYVDFLENITITLKGGKELKPKKLRYSFKTGNLSMED